MKRCGDGENFFQRGILCCDRWNSAITLADVDTNALDVRHTLGALRIIMGTCQASLIQVTSITFVCLAFAVIDANSLLKTMYDIDGKTLTAEVKIVAMRITGHQDQQIRVQVEKLQGKWFSCFLRHDCSSECDGGMVRWVTLVDSGPLLSVAQ
ncbi:MAG: hypothetical protein ACSLEN_10240 [Candidatus Malihini olakiniferum]